MGLPSLGGAAAGLIGGAAGTVALDVATYLDVIVRGRQSSDVPAKVAGSLAAGAGVPLRDDRPETAARRSGLGAMLGCVTGLGLGALYGVVGPRTPGPALARGAALGLAAMAASDVPAVATGATDPRRWGSSGWLADAVPHLVYGVVTTWVVDRLRRAG